MTLCCSTMTNKDIKDTIPQIVQCIQQPELVNETVHQLAGVVFVQEIDAAALAIMCPLLKRGMDEPATATKRNVARIIENMAKLVDDPYEVEPFVPLLLPHLERAKDEVSDPEARNVCDKAFQQLGNTSRKPPIWQRIEHATVLKALEGVAGKADDSVVNYVAGLAFSML